MKDLMSQPDVHRSVGLLPSRGLGFYHLTAMISEQIWTANAYRNFNYLIACHETGEALAIDPLDSEKCLAKAKDKGWEITQILNTHEHHDHIGGNDAVVKATGAKVLAHAKAWWQAM
mgnify:CR=1 FL=1